jgi:hypothetical protein
MKNARIVTLVLSSMLAIVPLAMAQTAKPAPAPKAPAAQAADPAAKLPAPILAAFKQSYPNAIIQNAARETEDGKTVWEVESLDNNMARDLVYNPDGTVVEVEEEVAAASVPPFVADAVKAKYPKATVTRAEKKTAGKVVTYEFTLKGAKESSVEMTPDGKIVPAKKDKDEKEDDDKAEKKAPIKK